MNRMTPSRAIVGFAIGLCLIAGAPALAKSAQKHKHTAHHHRHSAGINFRNAAVKPLKFSDLDGWQKDNTVAAFAAFIKSCEAIKHASKAARKARPFYGGLYNACMNAPATGEPDREAARKFFEANFKPVRISVNQTIGYYTGTGGFYTGYWELQVAGSRKKTDEFTVPLYRTPKSGGLRHLDRSSIVAGALKGKGLEICWIKDPIDAFFAEIQGSIRVKLDTGELLRINFDSSNGKHYTPVGRILIDRGIYTPEEMSMAKIREYMTEHPKEGKALRLMNHSFVFFKETPLKPDEEPVGAEGIPLTPGRSLAVDASHHVYGTPIWINAKFPIESTAPEDKFQHLMFAQDTGGAIRGVARADIYFGHGEGIGSIAGRIKQFGEFVMLAPKDVSVKATGPGAIPLPRPRPKEISVQEAMAKGKDAGAAVTGTISASAATKTPLPKPRP
jgi:membrane-bound lytic murein transglycosylase A